MRFVHITVHEVLGTIGPDEGETVLLDDPDSGIWACLTKDPNQHCEDSDQSLAISMMLLRGVTGDGPEGSFGKRLAKETEMIRAEREPRKKGRTYLVLRREGEIEDWEPHAEREVDEFVLRLNGAPRMQIREVSRSIFSALVLSLALVVEHPLKIDRYCDSVVFNRDDGKKVFAMVLDASGSVTVATSFPNRAAEAVGKMFRIMARLNDLTRVLKLFTASLESAEDRLRSFQAGWAALEIFVNKVFSQYEEEFFTELESDDLPKAHSSYITRIRTVMNDKYRLTDRFSLIASRLAPEHADEDVDRFIAAKKSRDALAHGQNEDEASLPVDTVQELLKRYLERHSTGSIRN